MERCSAAERSLAIAARCVAEAIGRDPQRVHRIDGGHSAMTFAVDAPRHPPLVARVSLGGRDSHHRTLRLIDRMRSSVPVPDVVWAGDDDVTGAHVVIMRCATGRRVDAVLNDCPGERAAIGHVVGDVLSRIHGVLFDFPGWLPFDDLTLEPRSRSYAAGVAAAVHESLSLSEQGLMLWGVVERQLPRLDVAEQEAHLVHADFTHTNLMVERTTRGWAVTCVLDWEFAFSGPAAVDYGAFLRGCQPEDPLVDGLSTGLRRSGVQLDGEWRALAWLADLVSATSGLRRSAGDPLHVKSEEFVSSVLADPPRWLEER